MLVNYLKHKQLVFDPIPSLNKQGNEKINSTKTKGNIRFSILHRVHSFSYGQTDYEKAWNEFNTGNFEASISYFKEAVKNTEDKENALLSLSFIHSQLNRKEEASNYPNYASLISISNICSIVLNLILRTAP